MDNGLKLIRLQQFEKKALKAFIEFCNHNELTYYLRGGSVLGAVKYHDMIPWDDDIDIVLPRKDYNRLIEIFPEEIYDFEFKHYSRDERLNCYFARLYLNEQKRVVAELPINSAHGLVLVDILPIDGVNDNVFFRKFEELKVNFLRLLASVHTLDKKNTVVKRKGVKKIVPEILNKMRIHKLYSQTEIYRKLECVYASNDYEKSEYVGVLASSKGSHELFPKEWIGNGKIVQFDYFEARIPESYDMYLKRLFGDDYMRRNPSKAERVSKHFEEIL